MNQFAALGLIALGGAAGSVIRALLGMTITARFPWTTLFINVLGSLLIGWLMARLGSMENAATAVSLRSLLVVGFCGGFTTFSTFSWQTLEQLVRGEWGAAVANVMLSVLLCLLAVWVGYRVGHA